MSDEILRDRRRLRGFLGVDTSTGPSRFRSAALGRDGWADGALLLGIAIVAALSYAVWRAPVLDSSAETDAWFYLGFFVDFHYLFGHFSFTYYAARLPWIVIGQLLYGPFPRVVAFFVMHTGFFFGGALSVYSLFRRYYGRTVALIGFAALITNLVYFVAHSTDYVDGAVITFLLVALACSLPRATGWRGRISLACAGVAAIAAVGTDLSGGLYGLGLVLIWGFVRLGSDLRWRRVADDVVAFVVGAVLFLVVMGGYSKSQGGHAFFVAPQFNALGGLHSASYRIAGLGWLIHSPKIFVIPALLVLFALVWPRRPWTLGDRLSVGSAAYGAYLTVLAVLWEHHGGAVLEESYAFSIFTPGVALCLGAVLYRLRAGLVAKPRRISIALGAVVIAALPNVIVYVDKPSAFMLSTRGVLVVLAIGLLAAVAVVLTRLASLRLAATIVAGIAVVGGTNLASAASLTTAADVSHAGRNSFTDRRQDMNLSLDLVRYMQRTGLQDAPLAFWAQDVGTSHAMLSTYLYLWTTAGRNLPVVDAELRRRLVYFHPYHLVQLCPTSCKSGWQALRHAGYRVTKGRSTVIGTGSDAVHVQVLNFPSNRVRGPYDSFAKFYAIGQTTLGFTRPVGAPVASWNLGAGVPKGWTGASVTAARAAHGAAFDTGRLRWEYELASMPIRLRPGSYAAYLRGNVPFGGLDLGVLDAKSSQWFDQSLYWFRQVGFSAGWMSVRFRLRTSTPVKLILSNWVPSPRSSRWSLQELRLVRLGRTP